LTKEVSKKLLDSMLAFAGGVMIAASYWSLLAPAIEMSEGKPIPSWVPPAVGFLAGGVFMRAIDMVLPHLHIGLERTDAEGIQTSWRRSTLLVLAIMLYDGSNVGGGRTHRRRHRRLGRNDRPAHTSLRARLCGGSDDIRGRRRGHPRSPA